MSSASLETSFDGVPKDVTGGVTETTIVSETLPEIHGPDIPVPATDSLDEPVVAQPKQSVASRERA
ncbi:MAG TPA: hypothetical protein VNQ76_12435, partial [Planctomicrobium sp.]|nr:hypothetical protein [Planctomicrobium sp.]